MPEPVVGITVYSVTAVAVAWLYQVFADMVSNEKIGIGRAVAAVVAWSLFAWIPYAGWLTRILHESGPVLSNLLNSFDRQILGRQFIVPLRFDNRLTLKIFAQFVGLFVQHPG